MDLPPDPYDALGVAKDADVSAIKSAHRKLVLKCHPDRIQDPALKEKGKEAFQKIQQAYELLTDPSKKARYDDQVRLAALRREAMARDGPTTRSQTYPIRHGPPPPPASRHYSPDDGVYFEERRPRNEDFSSSREKFEEPLRTSSRKHTDYDRASSTKKPAEKERSDKAKAGWSRATGFVNAGIRLKKETDKTRASKEAKERTRQKERSDKEQRARHAYVDSESDSDTATRVTSSTIKPSRPTPRHSPQSSSSRPSTATRRPTHVDDDSGDESDDALARKWEAKFDKTKQYIEKATLGAGSRPKFERHESGSYWSSHHRSGSDPDRYASSGKERERRSHDDSRRPSMPTMNSSPANLKARVEERSPKDRRSAGSASYRDSGRDRDSDHRKDIPGLHRSQTMPVPRSSGRKDAAPSKSSNLKHAETHDSGYGSSSTPHTPDPRDDSPVRRNASSRTKYQIVDPDSGDDGASTIHRVDDTRSRHRDRRYASPEPISPRDSDRRRPDRPRLDTNYRSKSSRESPIEPPKVRRSESARYDDHRSGRDSNSSSRYNSREKLDTEDYEYETRSPRYKEKDRGGLRDPYAESNAGYGDKYRDRDYAPKSTFHSDARGSRRPSMQTGVH
ncbi:uncharacterized protein AB675_8801 [Cyphellophora attinorum]|uniref:J domain-containing protein n=1 Tax=Cyphellophora attinorum TaxID=1664694 RepID=A0A0N1HGA4_9EURO|nr:uncharacterized protein AB675_8801 [Phialophora attinorum]KPI44595.1 hypothetical protein AB675_8801 [Phialophora attinorum]